MMSSTVNRLGAVTVLGIIALLAAGCTSPTGDKNDEAVVDTEPKVELCVVDNNEDDDVVPITEVTDVHGTYCLVGLDPNSTAIQLSSKIFNAAAAEKHAGVLPNQAAQMHERHLSFLVEKVLDTVLLDTPDALTHLEFFEESIAPELTEAAAESYSAGLADGTMLDRMGLTTSDYYPTPINRDGDARAYEFTVKTTDAYGAVTDDGLPVMVFKTDVLIKFHTTEKGLVEAAVKNERGTLAEIKKLQPTLFDGKDDDDLVIDGTFTMWYSADGKLTGTNTQYEVTTGRAFKILN